MKNKNIGYIWGLISLIMAILSVISPFILVMCGRGDNPLLIFFFLGCTPLAIILAFLARKNTLYHDSGRKLANIGATIAFIFSIVYLWAFASIIMQEQFNMLEISSVITAGIDSFILNGFIIYAYVKIY